MRAWACSWNWMSLGLLSLASFAAGCGGSAEAPPAKIDVPASAPAESVAAKPGPVEPEVVVQPSEPDPPPPVERFPEPAATDVLKKLLISMVERDQATIEAICFPHPELAMLWFGEKPPQRIVELYRKEIETIAFSKLLPGDKIVDFEGKPITLQFGDVKENQLLITCPKNVIPFFLEKQAGVWKVHATPIIAAKKSDLADIEAEQAEADAGASGQPPVAQPAVQSAEQLGGRPVELKR